MTDRGGSTVGSIWADGAKDAVLRAMHAQGAPYRAIAVALGCSRNAVIGRAMRIFLPARGEPRKRQIESVKTRHSVTRMNLAKFRAAEIRAKRALETENLRARLAQETNGTSADQFDAAIPKRQRKTFFQLTDRTCRFPVGDPGTKSFFFCGGKADNAGGQVYCAVHSRRAFNGSPNTPRISRLMA